MTPISDESIACYIGDFQVGETGGNVRTTTGRTTVAYVEGALGAVLIVDSGEHAGFYTTGNLRPGIDVFLGPACTLKNPADSDFDSTNRQHVQARCELNAGPTAAGTSPSARARKRSRRARKSAVRATRSTKRASRNLSACRRKHAASAARGAQAQGVHDPAQGLPPAGPVVRKLTRRMLHLPAARSR